MEDVELGAPPGGGCYRVVVAGLWAVAVVGLGAVLLAVVLAQ